LFKLKVVWRLRWRVAQITIEDEGVYEDLEMVSPNQRFGRSILKPFVFSFYMMDHSMFVQCVGEISNVWLLYLRDLPHTYSYTYLFKKEQSGNKGSTSFEYRGA
jgi:hypothetical protein